MFVRSALLLCGCILADPASGTGPSHRVVLDDSIGDRLEVLGAELVWNSERKCVRVRLRNRTEENLHVRATTSCRNASERDDETSRPRANALDALTRRLVRLISLGASEIAIDEVRGRSTSHELSPGSEMEVTHSLPDDSVPAEVCTRIVLDESKAQIRQAKAAKESRKKDLRAARDRYYREREEEEARWSELRQEYARQRERQSALSPGYRESMDRYWEDHAEHLRRLKRIEANYRVILDGPASGESPETPSDPGAPAQTAD